MSTALSRQAITMSASSTLSSSSLSSSSSSTDSLHSRSSGGGSSSNIDSEIHRQLIKLNITNETIDNWREHFALFDNHKLGAINTEYISTIIRAINFNISEFELRSLINGSDNIDGSNDGTIDFSQFIALIIKIITTLPHTHMHNGCLPSTEDMIQAFASFDPYNTGRLHSSDLYHMLTERGEPLSVEDATALVSEIEVDGDGFFNIEQFVKHIKHTSRPTST